MISQPIVTIAVPSYNQGRFLEGTLNSIFEQELPVEVFVADAGSTDQSIDIIRKFEGQLSGWRSHADRGQAAAINESIAKGTATYVGWLNSDDVLLSGGLKHLVDALERNPIAPAAYGKVWNQVEATGAKQIDLGRAFQQDAPRHAVHYLAAGNIDKTQCLGSRRRTRRKSAYGDRL